MEDTFKTIGLIGRQRTPDSVEALSSLVEFLKRRSLAIVVEEDTAELLPKNGYKIVSKEAFAASCDLVIVVGGDGSLLNAAHLAVERGTPVLGINRGRLGFLTDIHPSEVEKYVNDVLDGKYITEQRFLLDAKICHGGETLHHQIALNEVVLLPGEFSHMIEFEIVINGQLVCSQRSDGQIISTPTGSTAYALSGGGPIVHPNLDAIVLVPMFSHTLSSRPIVIDGGSEIEIVIAVDSETSPQISCDGQDRLPISPGDKLRVTKKAEQLTLLHPTSYNYYETLRKKLGWQTKLS